MSWLVYYLLGAGITLWRAEHLARQDREAHLEAVRQENAQTNSVTTEKQVQRILRWHPFAMGLLSTGRFDWFLWRWKEEPQILFLIFWPVTWGIIVFKFIAGWIKKVKNPFGPEAKARQIAQRMNVQNGIVTPSDYSLSQARMVDQDASRGLSAPLNAGQAD